MLTSLKSLWTSQTPSDACRNTLDAGAVFNLLNSQNERLQKKVEELEAKLYESEKARGTPPDRARQPMNTKTTNDHGGANTTRSLWGPRHTEERYASIKNAIVDYCVSNDVEISREHRSDQDLWAHVADQVGEKANTLSCQFCRLTTRDNKGLLLQDLRRAVDDKRSRDGTAQRKKRKSRTGLESHNAPGTYWDSPVGERTKKPSKAMRTYKVGPRLISQTLTLEDEDLIIKEMALHKCFKTPLFSYDQGNMFGERWAGKFWTALAEKLNHPDRVKARARQNAHLSRCSKSFQATVRSDVLHRNVTSVWMSNGRLNEQGRIERKNELMARLYSVPRNSL